MALDTRALDRRIQKLRKGLRDLPKDPTVEEIHDLRTRTRRVESTLQSLDIASSGNERKVLARLKGVRKRAGKVRDMDVLTSEVIGLGMEDDPECVVRLTHHLGMDRYRQARKLHAEVRPQANALRRRLKRSRRKLKDAVERFVQTKFELDSKSGDAEQAPLHAISEALRLSQELASVKRLGRDNLHAYRIEVKRLRYVLEMGANEDHEQQALIDELKRVQDLIGEWHDWVELGAIAKEVLQHDGCKLLKRIDQTKQRKFEEALRATERMRRRYLAPSGARRKAGVKPGPVLVAASQIAA